jgi:hypothetical protein
MWVRKGFPQFVDISISPIFVNLKEIPPMSLIQKIRDKGALISAIVIAIALLGFILMDAFSGRTGIGSASTTIGKINGKEIEYVDFDRKVKAQEAAAKHRVMIRAKQAVSKLLKVFGKAKCLSA